MMCIASDVYLEPNVVSGAYRLSRIGGSHATFADACLHVQLDAPTPLDSTGPGLFHSHSLEHCAALWTALHSPPVTMSNDDILTDDYVAGLLDKDAGDFALRYSAMGMEALESDKK